VVIQHANNEIGTVQQIRKIKNVIGNCKLLVDASQSVLYEDVSLERLGADILVLDGIKMYGPRGMGILAVKHGIKISPIVFGGGQESGLRSGTENVAGAVGLAKALEIAVQKREKESKRLTNLRNYAIVKIGKEIPNSSLNGDLENRLPSNINICLVPPKPLAKEDSSKFDSEFLVIKLDTLGFAVSAASACHTLTLENGSYVIESLGKPECAGSSLRITLGRDTKKIHLDSLISALKKIVK
jgi:cysteine desulfurase